MLLLNEEEHLTQEEWYGVNEKIDVLRRILDEQRARQQELDEQKQRDLDEQKQRDLDEQTQQELEKQKQELEKQQRELDKQQRDTQKKLLEEEQTKKRLQERLQRYQKERARRQKDRRQKAQFKTIDDSLPFLAEYERLLYTRNYNLPMTVMELALLERLEGYMKDYMDDYSGEEEDLDEKKLNKYLEKREKESGFSLTPIYKLTKKTLDWWAFNSPEEKRDYYKNLARQRKREEDEKWKDVYLDPDHLKKKPSWSETLNPIWGDEDLQDEIKRLQEKRDERYKKWLEQQPKRKDMDPNIKPVREKTRGKIIEPSTRVDRTDSIDKKGGK